MGKKKKKSHKKDKKSKGKKGLPPGLAKRDKRPPGQNIRRRGS